LAITGILPPPGRQEQPIRTSTNPPPAIESYEHTLDDITQITNDWETFKQNHDNITCERNSETEFMVPTFQTMTYIDNVIKTN
jgi:hypothetical protein